MSEQSDTAVTRAVDLYTDDVLELAGKICQIPAPTFAEEARVAFVQERFAELHLETRIDAADNVCAWRPGRGEGVLLVSAHTDTVFPNGTDLTVRREGDRLMGPGIGDNSLSVATLLTLPRMLDAANIETSPDILLCANTGEEGLGNLRGIRQIVDENLDPITGVLVLEGHGLGRVVHRAVGSRRLRITVEGPGGHSYGDFGTPSAIHVLGRIITGIADLPVPSEPKTTFNVGHVEGGVSINTIAPAASLTLDLRSVDPDALDALHSGVQAVIAEAIDEDAGITVSSETIGERPAGSIPADTPIVRATLDILESLGVDGTLEAGSTDANIPISKGIPTVCIGLTTGGHTHRVDEYIDVPPLHTGLEQLVLLIERIGGPLTR
jgi:tripeptide aminopeptidase